MNPQASSRLPITAARLLNGAGLVGVGLIVAGIVVSAAAYRGSEGQLYRAANHFVSELGERGVSVLSWTFNLGLVFGGACIIGFVVSLISRLRGWFRFVLLAVGITTGVFATLVGVFPMNNLTAHVLVANGFFYTGLVTMVLFATYVVASRHRELPRWTALPGYFAAGALFAFLFLGGLIEARVNGGGVSPGFGVNRPDIWVSALFEWVALAAVLFWVAAIAGIIAANDLRR
jgi:hypothetical membrane protein